MRRVARCLVLVALIAPACGGREPATQRAIARRAEAARSVARRAGLSGAVQDFVALYASAPGAKVSVTYAVSPAGGTIRLDQKPPERRVDVTGRDDPGIRSSIQTTRRAYSCQRADGMWACQRDAEGGASLASPLDPRLVNQTVSALISARDGYELRVGRRKLLGKQASCLVTTPRAGSADAARGPTSLCVSGQGTPLLVERAGENLRATRYSTHVDAGRFRLPATPTA